MPGPKPTRAVALALALAFLAAACGSDSDEAASTTTKAGAVTTAKAAGVAVPAGSTVEALQKKGKLVVGTKFDQPLFGLKNPTTGDVEGFDVEIAKLVATALYGSDLKGKVEYVEAVSRVREDYIKDGKVDLVAATYTINDTRKQVVDFAGPYYVAGQDILVKKDNTTIKGVNDLNGKKVCSVTGSTSLKNIQEKAPQADVSIVFDKYSLCRDAMLDGRVDAVSTDNVILLGLVQETPDKVKLVGVPFTTEPYGIGLKKGDTALRTFVNDVLEASYKDGSWKKAWDATAGKVQPAPEPPKVDRYP
ncbi:MAG: glutamate ABC transporter substrate-binding protein [Acidimicrobiales bacterium]